jgi:hypothetical protein
MLKVEMAENTAYSKADGGGGANSSINTNFQPTTASFFSNYSRFESKNTSALTIKCQVMDGICLSVGNDLVKTIIQPKLDTFSSLQKMVTFLLSLLYI